MNTYEYYIYIYYISYIYHKPEFFSATFKKSQLSWLSETGAPFIGPRSGDLSQRDVRIVARKNRRFNWDLL